MISEFDKDVLISMVEEIEVSHEGRKEFRFLDGIKVKVEK